jgi:hypothetical protein
MKPKELILANGFDKYEEDMEDVFSSENEQAFLSNLKQFKYKYGHDKNALFLAKIMKLVIEVPLDTRKQQWIRKSEANYSEYFVWQLFKTVTKFINNDSLCFEIGEYKLESIKNEIVRRGDDKLKACSYNADGCHTCILGGKAMEFSLLEVTGAFGVSDIARATKDHVKGGFGVLALIQEIAHTFEFDSISIFHQIKVCFVQTLGNGNSFLKFSITNMFVYIEEKVRLWSLEQASPGVCVMELIETATVPTSFED